MDKILQSRHKMAELIGGGGETIYTTTKDSPEMWGGTQTESKWIEKDVPCPGNQKKAGVTIVIWNKIDSKWCHKRQRKGYYIMIKVSIEQEDVTFVNTYVPNKRLSNYKSKY